MGEEKDLTLRLRKFVEQRKSGLVRRDGAQAGEQVAVQHSTSVSTHGQEKASDPVFAAPFRLPAAYSDMDDGSDMTSRQIGGTSSAAARRTSKIENRKSVRKTTKLTGVIRCDGSSLDIDVLVNDMSMHGVRLTIDRNNPYRRVPSANPYIAQTFKLEIPFDKMDVQCKLVWRKGDSFGAVFSTMPRFQP